MKLTAWPLAIVILVCAFTAPAQAQQTQSGEAAQERQGRERPRSWSVGRFGLELATNQPGYIKSEEEAQPARPTVQIPRATPAIPDPRITVRPGALVVAPATEDKGDD